MYGIGRDIEVLIRIPAYSWGGQRILRIPWRVPRHRSKAPAPKAPERPSGRLFFEAARGMFSLRACEAPIDPVEADLAAPIIRQVPEADDLE